MAQPPITLSPAQLLERMARQPGLIPVDFQEGRIIWLDVGETRLDMSKFYRSVNALLAGGGELHATELAALAQPGVVADSLRPSGFIFHIGRCGSTLLAKALARSHRNVVIVEASPCDRLLGHLTDHWRQPLPATDQARTLLRHMLLALGRRRTPQQDRFFIKFTSINTLFMEAIRQAFPEVPCLFVYRNPEEVLVSWERQPPFWLDPDNAEPGAFLGRPDSALGSLMTGLDGAVLGELGNTDLMALYTARMFRTVVTLAPKGLRFLDYRDLSAALFPLILRTVFHCEPDADELAQMQGVFKVYSKDDTQSRDFMPDREGKRQAVTPAIAHHCQRTLNALYDRLDQAPQNLCRTRARAI